MVIENLIVYNGRMNSDRFLTPSPRTEWLNLQIQRVSPSVMEEVRVIESCAGAGMVRAYYQRFGVFPSDKMLYLQRPSVIPIPSRSFNHTVGLLEDLTVEEMDAEQVSIDGKIYAGYSPNAPKPFVVGQLLPQGRTPIVRIPYNKTIEGSGLSSRDEYVIELFFNIIHEKAHGLQQIARFPLPVLEAMAMAWEEWVKELLNIQDNSIGKNPAVNFFHELVDEFGENPSWGGVYGKDVILQVIMGELGSKYKRRDRHAAEELRQIIRDRFEKHMGEIFPDTLWEEASME